jgi:hypothetical protein
MVIRFPDQKDKIAGRVPKIIGTGIMETEIMETGVMGTGIMGEKRGGQLRAALK